MIELSAQLHIRNSKIACEDGTIIEGELLLENGVITEISRSPIQGVVGESLDAQGCLALPGFIDIHIHGAEGADFMDGTDLAFETVSSALSKEGTTSFLATTITQSESDIIQTIATGRRFMNKHMPSAEMLGIHLEGPFIHEEQAGAQPRAFIRKPSSALVEKWFAEGIEMLKVVTMAPELDEEFALTTLLAEKKVIVSAGHTKATCRDIQHAIEHGLTHLTHFGNAMSGLHHREIGVVGAGFLFDQLTCEVIADGVHTSKEMLQLMFKTMGSERIILITDSMRAKGLSNGVYSLGGQEVSVCGNKATLEDGTLAGSILRMDDALRNLFDFTSCSVQDLVNMTSANAAKRLGVFNRKGSLAVGKDADIVLLDNDLQVHTTICRGQMCYKQEHPSSNWGDYAWQS